MKRLFLISASLLIASTTFAQSGANSDNSLYRFDNTGSAKEVRKLGSAPEFPFLRNMNSSHQVYAAIKRHADDDTRSMHKLNDLLMQIGYTNGAKDLQASDISETHIQPGTEGNMGSRGYTYGYYRLEGNASEFKAWRIAANPDGNASGNVAVYLFAKCGNAFFPKTSATACVSVPVTVTPDMSQVILNNSGNTTVTKDQTYVYYEHKHRRKFEDKYPMRGLDDRYASRPIMVDHSKTEDVMPETYTISLNAPENSVSACQDATLNLNANINVEKTSSYTGNYPNSDNKNYKRVSKHHYKVIARRMRRVHRKEAKVARRTNMAVDVRTNEA